MTAAIANTTTTVVAGEGGLGAYLTFCDSMAETCDNGVNIAEATLGDMYKRGWFGEKTVDVEGARDKLAAARDGFKDAKAALEKTLSVTEAYSNNVGAGDRESVTNV